MKMKNHSMQNCLNLYANSEEFHLHKNTLLLLKYSYNSSYLLNHFKSFNIAFLSLKKLGNNILPFLFYWGLSLRLL